MLALLVGVLRPLQQIERAAKVRDDVNEQLASKLLEEEQSVKRRRDLAIAAGQVAQDQLALLTTGAGVQAFLGERAASDDYRSQLGLVALVRRDLEQLSRTLSLQGSPIDRVILYIDDLDRCSAERVVEVLEAVHLLLAFDLFVVVVGVDSRWLLSSLRHVYTAQFGTSVTDDASWVTTPQNYLEKIFQIPFAVPAMEPEGFGQFVRAMLAADVARADLGTTPPNGTEAHDGAADQKPRRSGDKERLVNRDDTLSRRPLELRPRSIEITQDEVAFIASLGQIVPSPRAGKRLINSYRLLRAPLSEVELEAFEKQDGEFRIVASLLAIMTGFPAIASRVFGAILAEPDEGSWGDFSRRARDHVSTAVDAAHWARFSIALDALDRTFDDTERLEAFRRWVPRVARYSFETSRLTVEALATP